MAKYTQSQMNILIKIIAAVETGGQIYGQARYDDYTPAYANCSNETSCTIGAFQEYGSLAKGLLQEILNTYPTTFRKYDNEGIESDLQRASWTGYSPARGSVKAKAIQAIISSPDGIKVQNNRIQKQMESHIAFAQKQGVSDVDALFMCANFIHQGGQSACTRILKKTQKPYTLDHLYAACQTDTGNQVGAYESRQRFVYNALKTYFPENEVQQMATVKISNCGHDENGRYAGGKAGDQTGTEYQIMNWYSRPWLCVLRFEDKTIADMIADMATKAAQNDHIGYDQGTVGNDNDRYTFWQQLKANGYDPAKIKKDCESDCSASTAAIIKGAGCRLNNAKLKAVSIYLTTYDMRQALKDVGAKVLTDSKYLKSGDYIKAGDVLLNDDHHVAIAITSGSLSGDTETPNQNSKMNTRAYIAQIKKDTKCYTKSNKNSPAKLFPKLKKGVVVEVMKYTETDSSGLKWYFIRIPYPNDDGFVFEFIPKGTFTRITEISK